MSGPEHSNDIEVVGVVRDAKYYSLDEPPEAFAYYPYTQYAPIGAPDFTCVNSRFATPAARRPWFLRSGAQ